MAGRPRVVLAILVAAQVLAVANANLIAVALPPLSADLGASDVQQQWIVDAYVLVLAALLITGGVLGDRLGRRRTFTVGLGVFATGSLACAVAGDPGLLIAARVVQGLGPPLVLPASLALVSATFDEPRARGKAVGIWGAGSGLGIATGPLIGGLIVAGLGWRWTFAFNVPAAAALVAAALAAIPADAHAMDQGARPPDPFDVRGAVLVTLTMAATVFAIIESDVRPVGLALVGLVTFVFVERDAAHPLVDLALVRERTFATANAGAAMAMFALLPVTVFVSSFLQRFQNLDALGAGLGLLPLGGAVAATAPLSGRLTSRVVPRWLIAGGLLTAAVGLVLLSGIGPADGAGELWPALAVTGAGIGVALPASTAVAVSAAPPDRTGMASAIHNAGRQLGATLGIAVLGAIILGRAGGVDSSAGYCDGMQTAFRIAAAALVAAAAAASVP
jgi:DHA2 family methylenomycin A resistance protein-like MFS transporter